VDDCCTASLNCNHLDCCGGAATCMLARLAACASGGTAAAAGVACTPVGADDVLQAQLMSVERKQDRTSSLLKSSTV
jgi:hypothetical protein